MALCAGVCITTSAAWSAPVVEKPAPKQPPAVEVVWLSHSKTGSDAPKEISLQIPDPKCDRANGKLTTVSAQVKKAKLGQNYVVVTSRTTYDDKAWREVVRGLAFKYDAPILVYKDKVEQVKPELVKRMPWYTCFVLRPEEANRNLVTHIHRLTRKLDDDPYTDTIWGILTGYSAADAARIVATSEPLVLRKAAAGTPISLDKFDEGIWYDEGKKNHGIQKTPDGKTADIQTPDDTTESIVKTINEFKPDYFQTSGHASERDWAPGYSYPSGRIICKDGALMGVDLAGKTYAINSPNPKVYAPFGNCLIGNIPDKNCMALACMASGGAAQMIGYVVPTWYGYGGWGIGNYFFDQPGKFSFAESFYLNNQALVNRLITRFPANAGVEFDGWDGPDWGMGEYSAKLGKNVDKDEFGLHWDRDTVAFYGDPAWRATAKPQASAWEQNLTANGDTYTFEVKANQDATFGRPPAALFPCRLRMTRMLEGRDLNPVITDNFIMLPMADKLEKGKTLKVIFRAQKIGKYQISGLAAYNIPSDIQSAVKTAGDNASEILTAYKVLWNHKEAISFLITNMPECDLRTLETGLLVTDVELACQAMDEAPWGKSIPKDIFLNYVLPYANVSERRDDWRVDFYWAFMPIAKKFKTPGEAAVALNEAVFKELDVKYHATKRPKPDQSPYESVEAGYASCTGLSILLVDACRAVGIPARLVGIPMWADNSGNHTWVEVWDSGKWHALGAAEPGPLDQTWFMDKAKSADKSNPEHRIYAVSFKKTDVSFPLAWDPSIKWVSAVDVTDAYTEQRPVVNTPRHLESP